MMSEEKKGLDEIIYEAIDKAPEAAPAEAQPEPVVEAKEEKPAKDGPGRDEKGRFAKKSEPDAAPEEAPAVEVPVQSADAKPETPPVAAEKPAYTDGHFRGWAPEQRKAFEALPAEAKSFALDLSKHFQAQLTKQTTEAAELRKAADPVLSALESEREFFAAQNMTPVEAFKGYANIERTLTFGNFAEKVDLIRQICTRYGVPFALQGPADPQDPQSEQYAALHDNRAEIARERAERLRLQNQLNTFERERLSQTVQAFQSATNPDGTPKHPHFETVKAAMSVLLQQGKAQSLDEAYALAAKPIEDLIAAKALEAHQKAERSHQEAIEKAKKASPVKASPAPLNGKSNPKGLDQVIAAALDAGGI